MQPLEDYASQAKTESASTTLSLPKMSSAHSLDELVSHSRNMSSASSKSADDVESSLADSTYEVVDARNLVSDDEIETHSESLPSCGGNTTDCDVSSVADTEEYTDNHLSVASLPRGDYPTPALSDEEAVGESIIEESSTTVRPANSSISTLIQFPEPTSYDNSGPYEDTALVKQQVATASAEDFQGYLQYQLKNPEVPISVEMRLKEEPLRTQGPFSVMLVGDLSGSKKDALVHKIASVLAAGHVPGIAKPSNPTRLNVVPISSSGMNESCPDVAVIESTGTELVVETCTGLRSVRNEQGRRKNIEAKINDEWVDMGVRDRVYGTKFYDLQHTPHLAIFVHGTADTKSAMLSSCEFVWDVEEEMYERGVPGIHLANQIQWTREPLNSDSDGVLRMTAQTGEQTEDVSPVDLDTFLRLHNGQLGRHLSFLESVRQDIRQTKSVVKLLLTCFNFEIGLGQLMDSPIKQITILACAALLVMSLVFTHMYQASTTLQTRENSVGRTSALNSSLVKLTNCTTAISAPPFSSLLSQPPTFEDSSERAAHSHLSEAIANGTEQFEAFPFADHFVAIKAPAGFTRLKDAPNLLVNASRSGKCLEANISKLVLEHYAVILEQEQSYGQVNLTVYTKTKPLVQQSILVNLGSFWRNGAAMSAVFETSTARGWDEVATLQSFFSNFTNRWVAAATNDARSAKDKIKAAIDAARLGTDTSAAAGAATWKTFKNTHNIYSAELSRIYTIILSNPSQPREALQKYRQFLGNASSNARSTLASIKNDFDKSFESLTLQVSRARHNLSKPPKLLHRLSANPWRPSSQPIDLGRTGATAKKIRNNAVSIWEKIFGKKTVSKAPGPSPSDTRMGKVVNRGGRDERSVIHVDSEVVGHTEMKKEADQTRHQGEEKAERLRKRAKHRKATKGSVRSLN